MMTLEERIRANPTASDADIRDQANSDPQRFRSATLTMAQATKAIAATIKEEAIPLMDRLLDSGDAAAGLSRTVAAQLGIFEKGGSIDFGDQLIRSVLAGLAGDPGAALSPEDADLLSQLSTGPPATESDVAAARLGIAVDNADAANARQKIRADAINAAARRGAGVAAFVAAEVSAPAGWRFEGGELVRS